MDQAPNIADLLSLNTEVLGNILDLVGLLLTVISAYATALYFFIARSGFVFRFFALLVLTVSFIFIGSFAFSYNLILIAYSRCTNGICQHPDLIYEYQVLGFSFTTLQFGTAAALTGVALASLVYVALAAMTLFPGWRAGR